MNWIWWIVLAVPALYVIFVLGPAVASYFSVFSRQKTVPLEERELSGTYYEPFAAQIRQGAAWMNQLPAEQVTVQSHDGITLAAEYCPGTGKKTVIFCHGYRANARNNFFAQAKDLLAEGYSLLLIHERGHGRSGGRHSTMGLLESRDVQTWIRWVTDRTPSHGIVLYGTSMGSTAVAYASSDIREPRVKAMVLDCGYTSPYEMMVSQCVKRHVPWQMVMPVVVAMMKLLHRCDIRRTTTSSLSRTAIPALFLYGTADDTVTPEQMQRAYDSCASEKQFLRTEGVGHTLAYVGSNAVRQQVLAFLNQYEQEQGGI